jgi:hypothetical protein
MSITSFVLLLVAGGWWMVLTTSNHFHSSLPTFSASVVGCCPCRLSAKEDYSSIRAEWHEVWRPSGDQSNCPSFILNYFPLVLILAYNLAVHCLEVDK